MRRWCILVLVFVCIFDFSGCTGLRKKFIRKRHKETPPPLYLDLKDYPKVPTKDMYDEYFLFVRGWLDELSLSIEEHSSHKRQKKSIDEALKNLEQVMYYYNAVGKENIAPLHEEFIDLRDRVHDPYFFTSASVTYMKRKIYRMKRAFETGFTYEKASLWMEE